MSYRSILVHLDQSPVCAARAELAINLALAHEAHLQAVAACGWPLPPAAIASELLGVGSAVPGNDATRRAVQGVAERIAERARERGLDSFTARIEEVAGVQYLVQMARTHDLCVVGQSERSGGDPIVPNDLPVQVLMGSGRPVLVVPWAGRFDKPLHTVLLAWSGTREAARAIADAMPLLRRARSIHLLGLEQTGRLDAQFGQGLADAALALTRHGLKPQTHIEPTTIDFGDALLSRAFDVGADLIVMGGYGHARAAEFVLGGVTRTVLASMTVPVLMSH